MAPLLVPAPWKAKTKQKYYSSLSSICLPFFCLFENRRLAPEKGSRAVCETVGGWTGGVLRSPRISTSGHCFLAFVHIQKLEVSGLPLVQEIVETTGRYRCYSEVCRIWTENKFRNGKTKKLKTSSFLACHAPGSGKAEDIMSGSFRAVFTESLCHS